MSDPPNELTQALTSALSSAPGDNTPATPGAADRLFEALYAELHQLARQKLRQAGVLTLLDTTALLHESFVKLRAAAPPDFPDSRHFLSYAAKAMRSVVVDLVRSREAARHGGGLTRVTLHTSAADEPQQAADEVLRVNEALEELAQLEPRLATVVELRYFAGLTESEVAALLGVTLRTVQRDWARARIYLSLALK